MTQEKAESDPLNMAFDATKIKKATIAASDSATDVTSYDWFRSIDSDIIINGKTIKEHSENKEYQQFATSGGVKNFFLNECLKNLSNEAQKENALLYLRQRFHQGGFMFPVDTVLNDKMPPKGLSLDEATRKKSIKITSTENGIEISETVSYGKVQVMVQDNPLRPLCGLDIDNPTNMTGILTAEKAGTPILKASGTLKIDFSKDGANPTFVSDSTPLQFGHDALKEYLITDAIDRYKETQKETISVFLNDENDRNMHNRLMINRMRPKVTDLPKSLMQDHKTAISSFKLQREQADMRIEYLQQETQRLQKLEQETNRGAVFIVPDQKQKAKLMPFLEVCIDAAKTPKEKLFFQSLQIQLVHHPEGTQLPTLKEEEKYLNQLKNGLDEKIKLVAPYLDPLENLSSEFISC